MRPESGARSAFIQTDDTTFNEFVSNLKPLQGTPTKIGYPGLKPRAESFCRFAAFKIVCLRISMFLEVDPRLARLPVCDLLAVRPPA